MKILLITLACSTLSQATVLRWFGLGNTDQEIPVSYPPQTLPVQAPHVVLQTPNSNHHLLNVRYINSPLLNIGAPTPLNLLNFIQGPRPFISGPVFLGPPVGIVISNGQAVIGKPEEVEQADISSNTNSIQYLSQSSDEENVRPVYIPNTVNNNNYLYPSGQTHTAAELVRPAIVNNFQPGFTGIDVSTIPQQYPIPSHNTNSNNVYVPPTQYSSSQTFQFPTYQQLPYPSSSNDFGRPNYDSAVTSPQESSDGEQQQNQVQLVGSDNLTNNVAFPTSDGQTQNVDQHSYELDNGTKVSEQTSVVTSADGSNNQLVKTGEYEYIDQNGKLVKVKWVADDNGFRVVP